MNCRRVEELIPLYVEGDLASGIADRVTSHLDWCGRCNWLADEYKESQNWLHSCEPPEFDEATLNGLKIGVLRRIEETSARPSLMASLMRHWSRRQVFALSAAVVIVFGMVVLYVYQTRAKVSVDIPILVESNPSEETARPDEHNLAGGSDKAPGAGLNKRHHPSRREATLRASYVNPTLAGRAPVPVGSQGGSPAEPGTALTNSTHTSFGDSSAMLRIEIQTSDPNIRIIWFAPKETDSRQTKPATD